MHIDWLSLYQDFDSIPVFADSLIQRIDHENGDLQWSNFVGTQYRGSYDSSIRIRSDGRRLEVSGNPSRWNKSNNLFGVPTVEAGIDVFNGILTELGLPTFWDEDSTHCANRQLQGGPGIVRSGLTITRVDLTQNYSTGGPRNSEKALHALRSFRHRNRPPTDYGSSLIWGTGSRRISFKYYLKAPELKKHMKFSEAKTRLVEWCESEGVLRFEICLKSMALKSRGLDQVRNWNLASMSAIVDEYSLHSRSQYSIGSYMEIRDILVEQHGFSSARAERAQLAALAYIAGHNLREGRHLATFYRLRRDLLLVGIDIAAECNVSSLRFSVETIQLQELQEPDWYSGLDADIPGQPSLKAV